MIERTGTGVPLGGMNRYTGTCLRGMTCCGEYLPEECSIAGDVKRVYIFHNAKHPAISVSNKPILMYST